MELMGQLLTVPPHAILTPSADPQDRHTGQGALSAWHYRKKACFWYTFVLPPPPTLAQLLPNPSPPADMTLNEHSTTT